MEKGKQLTKLERALDRIRTRAEIREKDIPPFIRRRLEGYVRVQAYRPNGIKNSLIVGGIVLLLFAIISIITLRIFILLPGIMIAAVFFVGIYLAHPTYCPICFREMKEEKYRYEQIALNVCNKCKLYMRVRTIPERRNVDMDF